MSDELERLAAACLFPGFAGLTLSDDLRRWLDRGLGGVVLFARNVRDREQLAVLTAALRAEQPDLLIAVDEEGGDVTRLEAASGSSYPGNLALGAVDDIELTEQVAGAMGSDLADVGINLELAPVADVNTNPRNPVIGVRSFGADPELVARHVAAFVSGMQGRGVAACAKHFPGHGDTEQDSHLELPVVAGRLEDALEPFRSAVEAGVRTIMTAHIRVPACGETPATMNSEILQGLLRDELGFTGLAITDALEMAAVSATVGVHEGAAAALAAGADALCLGALLPPESVHRTIVAAVASGRVDESRLREAVARVSETARWADRAVAETRADERLIGAIAARRAIQADGTVALFRSALVVELRPEPLIAAGEAGRGLGETLRSRAPETEVVRLSEPPSRASPPFERASPLEGHADRQLVVVLSDAHRHAWQRAITGQLLGAARDAIVVETGVPQWRPTAAGYIATFGAGRVNLEAAAALLTA
jgi:beta-N-acetylhexosaminidase